MIKSLRCKADSSAAASRRTTRHSSLQNELNACCTFSHTTMSCTPASTVMRGRAELRGAHLALDHRNCGPSVAAAAAAARGCQRLRLLRRAALLVPRPQLLHARQVRRVDHEDRAAGRAERAAVEVADLRACRAANGLVASGCRAVNGIVASGCRPVNGLAASSQRPCSKRLQGSERPCSKRLPRLRTKDGSASRQPQHHRCGGGMMHLMPK